MWKCLICQTADSPLIGEKASAVGKLFIALFFCCGRHGGSVRNAVASQREGPWLYLLVLDVFFLVAPPHLSEVTPLTLHKHIMFDICPFRHSDVNTASVFVCFCGKQGRQHHNITNRTYYNPFSTTTVPVLVQNRSSLKTTGGPVAFPPLKNY